MARPFEDHTPSQYTGSSLSSQTSLPAPQARTSYPPSRLFGDSGQTWNSRRGGTISPKTPQASRLVKIKSSPSHGALAAARKTSSHGRLHKRGTSTSSGQGPELTALDAQNPSGIGLQDVSTALAIFSDQYSSPSSSSVSKTKGMIKPFLRKLSSQEQTSIDLSRSAAENEGLGIYHSSEISGGTPYPDLRYGSIDNRGYHHRTTSGTSQISTNTTSSNHRYGTHYVHPMRQTPRPYTPILAASYHNSLDSELSAPAPIRASSEGNHFESPLDAPHSYAPLPSARRIPPSLRLGSGSFSHLTSTSQTNLPGTPSSLRRQAETIDTPDIMPHTARSSFESSFRKRSRANTQMDPETQAATVQALRQKFNEKEAAKDLKFQQAEARALEKEAKRKEKREQEERGKLESKERKRAKSNTTSEKSGVASLGTQDHSPPFMEEVLARPGPPRRRPTEKAGLAGKAVQSQWSLFWFKFKTVWLKLKRKMGGSST